MSSERQDPASELLKVPACAGYPAPSFWRREDVARVLPFALYMGFLAVADGLSKLGLSADDLRWLYPVKIGLVCMALYCYRHHYTELKQWNMSAGELLLSVTTGLVVLVLWVNLNADWMQVGTSAGFDPTSAGRVDWTLVVLRIAGAALVVPLMEELFWRSFLLRWIARQDFLNVQPARVGIKAITISVVLFGFEHNLWFAGIVAGLAYTGLYMRTRNLWCPIVAHAVTNGLLGVWVVSTSQWEYW